MGGGGPASEKVLEALDIDRFADHGLAAKSSQPGPEFRWGQDMPPVGPAATPEPGK